MNTEIKPLPTKPQFRLKCPQCGNTRRFIQVMAEEAHVVNGNLDYVRLLWGVVDHYICCECDEAIELDDHLNIISTSESAG
jgi:hypothetical protein